MYLQYIALIGAVFAFAIFFFYFLKRNKALNDARKDPNKTISEEYDAIGRSIIVDKKGHETHT